MEGCGGTPASEHMGKCVSVHTQHLARSECQPAATTWEQLNPESTLPAPPCPAPAQGAPQLHRPVHTIRCRAVFGNGPTVRPAATTTTPRRLLGARLSSPGASEQAAE